VLKPIFILTPAHRCDPRLAVAAARAGETGILDLTYAADLQTRQAAVRFLAQQAHSAASWGVRWDTLGDANRSPASLRILLDEETFPILILAGVATDSQGLKLALEQGQQVATKVLLEVCGLDEALAAQHAGYDGIIVKGHEAAGRVSDESTFLLLQRLHNRLQIPYWVQGGIGPDTAAAAFLAGAAGVVVCEQVWLAAESSWDAAERRQWESLDGSETVCLGEEGLRFRFFSRSGPSAVRELEKELAGGADWPTLLRQRLLTPGAAPLVPLGQEIAFARRLAQKHVSVAGIIDAFRRQVQHNLATARTARALAPAAPLAQSHGTHYPILQGPMTRVSDVPAFCEAVAANGALPFLALSLMTGAESHKLLADAKKLLGDKPLGVGILGFAPPELRKGQMQAINAVRPAFAIIAGGRPAQARDMEQHGITTYLHVPSPGLLEVFLRDGARKFIFEGRECGGHVGPRSSFCLWQSAIDVLLAAELPHPEELRIVFAGGIHDDLSAAMVAAAAAPLTAKGVQIGVLMGTGYIFTHEAVQSGAIKPEFQEQAIACRETVLLESGVGHATRCVRTPFAEEFNRIKKELIQAGKSPEEIRLELELLNVGRLRIASKGLARQSDPRTPEKKADLLAVDAEGQRRQGMYMIGQLAGLRDRALSMKELHEQVCRGGVEVLDHAAARPLPWPPVSTVRDKSAAIAIVGMACKFPGASDLRRYWENICNRVDAVREVPAERWRTGDFFNADRQAPDQVYSKWGGFLDPVTFDPVKWRIPPASLKSIEPIQLLALETAALAMADAGYDRRAFPREKAGVIFAAAGSHEVGAAYCFRTLLRHYLPQAEGLTPEAREKLVAELEGKLPQWTEDSFPGFLMNVVAGRIARELDFNGSNYAVDAACASSLAALHAAIEELRSGTADLMLVGGADATNNAFCFMSFAKTHALSPRGHCNPFDDSADGIALGEGLACLVLKRLADAERDGDKIYAVIKGIGSSSDGKNKSLTAPYPPGQARALTRAYADAGVSPASVSLIEAHGTGTAVGDSAELTTLSQVFTPHSADKQYAAVGSVKSMIGHTKAVAGLASLVKTVLALHHRLLPPTIGVQKPSKRIDFADSPFYLNTEARPWLTERNEQPRRAGVSAFGFGGTNFHVVLEEYTGAYHPDQRVDWTPRPAEVFCWRRGRRGELQQHLRRLHDMLGSAPANDLANVAAAVFAEEDARTETAATARLGLVAGSVEELRTKLARAIELFTDRSEFSDPTGIYYSESTPVAAEQVCFLYPGQGSQAVNMLRDLVAASPWSHDLFAQANRLLADSLPRPLSRYIYPAPVFDEADRKRQAQELTDTRVAQPALGVVELFATDLLGRFGIRPARLAGHSYGELVALHQAGCLTREELLKLSAQRGRMCAEAGKIAPGGMAAVQADADKTTAALNELNLAAVVANRNAPDQTIIGGTNLVIDKAVDQLTRKGLRTKRLPVAAAFHTPLLTGAGQAMANHLAGVAFRKPELTVYSNTTGAAHAAEAESIRGLLTRHVTEPVLFEKEVRQLYADGARIFIEVGPGKVLTELVGRILKDQPVTTLAVDAPGRDGWTQLGHVLARAWVLGLPLQLAGWFEGRGLTTLPTAAFVERAAKESQPKPSDWILYPNRAEPVTPAPKRAATVVPKASPVMEPATAPVRPMSSPVNKELPGGARPPVPTVAEAKATMTPNNQNVPINGHAPAGLDLYTQLQATTMQMLQWQQSQQQLVARFLEHQERMLQYCTLGGQMPPSILPVPSAPAPLPAPVAAPAPVAERAPVTNGSAVRPAPVAFKAPLAVPPRNGETVARAVVAPPVAVETPRPVAAPAAPKVEIAADSPPSTEAFRQDLLKAASERTGYPVDMLDENLPLESGLGIDSIKTVEIFSKLKSYHPYFHREGQDEEELLAEFTRLKTLRDIVNSYDQHRQIHVTGAKESAPKVEPTPPKPASGRSNGTVERLAVTAVKAPLEGPPAKKNYRSAISS
jgi:acyl transferase domain-containing protein/NAD(P)H-dependent flavin oxidoreductase YrpB (nitropropane dioxygenase family)